MMDQNLIEKIDGIMKQNKEFTRDMNEKLNYIRGGLTKKTDDVEEAYDRGLQDMWKIMYAISGDSNKGGLTLDECRVIFGWCTMSGVVEHLTCNEVVDKYKSYKEKLEKEKEEQEKEAQTFKRGDVVMCHSDIYPPDSCLVVYLGESEFDYHVLYKDYDMSQCVSKDNFRLTKTGKHIDLSLE